MRTIPSFFLIFCFLNIASFLRGQDAGLNLAHSEIIELSKKKKYTASDISEPIISDDYTSGGIRHIYYQQTVDQIGIYGTSAGVHLKNDSIIASNLQFLPQLEKRNIKKEFRVQALEAVARLALGKGYPLSQTELLVLEADNQHPQKPTTLTAAGISNRTIPLKLVYFLNQSDELQLAWSVFIDEVEHAEYKNFILDAATGNILEEKNLTLHCSFGPHHNHNHNHHHDHAPQQKREDDCEDRTENSNKRAHYEAIMSNSYRVLPFTIESPHVGNRSLVTNPWTNQTASPNGWHQVADSTSQYTFGNNIDAYIDNDKSNSPTGGNAARAFGGSNLVFDFPWYQDSVPLASRDAAITNLFYVGNIAHDILYNYGFDEDSGNFQLENHNATSNNAHGNDHVLCEAQDIFTTCNANMSVPGDGGRPRLQMMLCNNNRDGDFDNLVILHEYGHGVSSRLTGGPAASSCLGNLEQMGEGWSDFIGLIFTMKATDTKTTQRTVGTWLTNQGANDGGIRPHPYTTDMAVNPMTYKTIDDPGITRPHGVGAVWATMLWEMTWGLIDVHGWDADLYSGTGGNNIALKLVIEGMKLQPCSPGFVDARDAILAADLALYGGANRCIIWEAFAKRGLGFSAEQGSSNSRVDGKEGYDLPAACTIELKHSVDKPMATLGEGLTFTLEAINHLDIAANSIIISDTLPDHVSFYSASDGGVLNGNVVQWPAFNLAVGAKKTFEIKVIINDTIPFDPNFLDDCENGNQDWEFIEISDSLHRFNSWTLQNQHFSSGNTAWFIENANWTTESHLILKEGLGLTDSSSLTFNHLFHLEGKYDFGLVEISLDGGKSWKSLEDNFIQNGYRCMTEFGHDAYTGKSDTIPGNINGFITSTINLAPYVGEVAKIRFRLLTDLSTNEFGWVVDDIAISNTNYALHSFSNIRNNDYNFESEVSKPIIINRSIINHRVETQADSLFTIANGLQAYVDVQSNDIDPDGPTDTLVTTIITPPTNGTASVVNADSIAYQPNANFTGRDTLIYQVCDKADACVKDTVFVMFINSTPPNATADTIFVLEGSTNNLINVQANDSDPNEPADTLTTTITEIAKHGASAVVEGKTIQYSPSTDYIGRDTIIYQVCDIAGLCASDTVFIFVLKSNKAPVTQADSLFILENSINNFINVQANDSDPDEPADSMITSIVTPAKSGSAAVVDDDSIRYSPLQNFFGRDTLIYQVCDTATVCTSDTLFVFVQEINKAPITQSDQLTVIENSANNAIDVRMNDSDPNAPEDTLMTSIFTGPSNGTAIALSGSSVVYTPSMNYVGKDSLIYQVCDTANLCATDTLFINVLLGNRAPITQTDFAEIDLGKTAIMIPVQSNDSDPNGSGDTLKTSIITAPKHGTAQVMHNDSISYSPMEGYEGKDTIVYEVCDTSLLCTADTVFITVYQLFPCMAESMQKDENGIASGNYVVSNNITSSGTIQNPENVQFIAGNSITLQPGFSANAGSSFRATIQNCRPMQEANSILESTPELENSRIKNHPIAKNKLFIRPNPFSHFAVIEYELNSASRASLTLHDITGKRLKTLVPPSNLAKGNYQYEITGMSFPSGIYWVTLRTEKAILTKKVVIRTN